MSVVFLAAFALGIQDVPDLRTRTSGEDWPGFLGPRRDGKSSEKGLRAPWPAGGPRVVWQRKLGESFGTCSVQRGRAFHFDRFGDTVRLTCLKSETGEELWRFEHPTDYRDAYSDNHGPRGVPVADGDRVYVFGVEGMLHCLRAADGTVAWKKDTARDFGVVRNFFGVGSTPGVEGDLLIVPVGGSPPNSPPVSSGEVRGVDSGIVAFDKRTGEVKYKVTDELASYGSPVCATIGGRRWGFVFARGGLVGFEPASGKVDFHYPWRAGMINSVNACTPVVADDLVFVSEAYSIGGSVLRVRPGGYDVVWKDGRKRDRTFSAFWATPVHVDGYLYGSSGPYGSEPELRCVELRTGVVKWSVPGLEACSLLYVDGHFVALAEDGTLRLVKVNPKRYEEVSKAVLTSADGEPLLRFPCRAAPVLSHGLLYVRGKDRLVCLDLIPGK
jgi:outer membrane protein assembly factor BamB